MNRISESPISIGRFRSAVSGVLLPNPRTHLYVRSGSCTLGQLPLKEPGDVSCLTLSLGQPQGEALLSKRCPRSPLLGAPFGVWLEDYTSCRQEIRRSRSQLTKDLRRAKWPLITPAGDTVFARNERLMVYLEVYDLGFGRKSQTRHCPSEDYQSRVGRRGARPRVNGYGLLPSCGFGGHPHGS